MGLRLTGVCVCVCVTCKSNTDHNFFLHLARLLMLRFYHHRLSRYLLLDSGLDEDEPMQDLVTHHDGFAFMASTYHGAIRLRASGAAARRTLTADHHEYQLHIRLILDYHDGGGGGEHARAPRPPGQRVREHRRVPGRDGVSAKS